MIMVDEEGQHAMEAADKSKNEGIIIMPTTVSDPPEAGGVKAAPGTNKQRLRQIANTVAGRVIERTSVGRSTPIQTNPDLDLVKQNMKIGNAHTTPKGRKDPKSEKDHLNDEGHG